MPIATKIFTAALNSSLITIIDNGDNYYNYYFLILYYFI